VFVGLLTLSFLGLSKDLKNRDRVSAVQWCTASFGEKFALQDFPPETVSQCKEFLQLFTVTREKRWNVLRLKRPKF